MLLEQGGQELGGLEHSPGTAASDGAPDPSLSSLTR